MYLCYTHTTAYFSMAVFLSLQWSDYLARLARPSTSAQQCIYCYCTSQRGIVPDEVRKIEEVRKTEMARNGV